MSKLRVSYRTLDAIASTLDPDYGMSAEAIAEGFRITVANARAAPTSLELHGRAHRAFDGYRSGPGGR